MSLQDIDNFKIAWVAGVKRAMVAGFDVVEIHNGMTANCFPPQMDS